MNGIDTKTNTTPTQRSAETKNNIAARNPQGETQPTQQISKLLDTIASNGCAECKKQIGELLKSPETKQEITKMLDDPKHEGNNYIQAFKEELNLGKTAPNQNLGNELRTVG